MSDETLIQHYLNGNPNALATLVELHKDRIYRSIYMMLQDKYVAEEIFSQVFIKIIDNMMAGKTAEEGNFLKWAINIAHDLCMEYTRKSKLAFVISVAKNEHTQVNNFPVTAAVTPVLYHQSHNKIKSMIDMLPEEQREVLVLNHYMGLSLKEIADRMKCSVTVALDTMKFGLHNLRKLMNEKEVSLQ